MGRWIVNQSGLAVKSNIAQKRVKLGFYSPFNSLNSAQKNNSLDIERLDEGNEILAWLGSACGRVEIH